MVVVLAGHFPDHYPYVINRLRLRNDLAQCLNRPREGGAAPATATCRPNASVGQWRPLDGTATADIPVCFPVGTVMWRFSVLFVAAALAMSAVWLTAAQAPKTVWIAALTTAPLMVLVMALALMPILAMALEGAYLGAQQHDVDYRKQVLPVARRASSDPLNERMHE